MFKMEVDKFLSHSQYALPVGMVLILAILVFAFGFKTVAEPTFDKASNEEKKKKQVKTKTKVKKTAVIANGSASTEPAGDSKKPSASVQPKSPAKAAAKKESPKKTAKAVEAEVPKAEKKSGDTQQKKKEPKPVDYDEGDWVQAVSKKKKKPTDNASASASPATSPTHKAGKKADKKKTKDPVKKEDEKKNNEGIIIEKEPTQPTVEPTVEVEVKAVEVPVAEPEVVEAKIMVKQVTKEEKPAIEKPVKAQAGKKEKNNNNADSAKPQKPAKVEAKPVDEKITEAITPVNGDDSEDTWQENKAAKKKKKARRE